MLHHRTKCETAADKVHERGAKLSRIYKQRPSLSDAVENENRQYIADGRLWPVGINSAIRPNKFRSLSRYNDKSRGLSGLSIRISARSPQ